MGTLMTDCRPRRLRQSGFTLIELMVVVAIIGVIATLAVPRFRVSLVDARLNEAKAYLMEIAARQRTYKNEHGQYCCEAGTFNEEVLNGELGIKLNETGNFCFIFICRDNLICEAPAAINFIAPQETGDAEIEFEVWGILRESVGANVTGPQSALCEMDIDGTDGSKKFPPTGWVEPPTSAEPWREGRVIVLRYPPPINGQDATPGEGGLRFVWTDGVTVTHSLRP